MPAAFSIPDITQRGQCRVFLEHEVPAYHLVHARRRHQRGVGSSQNHQLFQTVEKYCVGVQTRLHQTVSLTKTRSYWSVESAAVFVYIRTGRCARVEGLDQPRVGVVGFERKTSWLPLEISHRFRWRNRNHSVISGSQQNFKIKISH